MAAQDLSIKIIHRLTQTSDYNPELVEEFVNSASGVNIQVWDITNAQNNLIAVSNSGCYQIGDTNQWGWSVENLQFDTMKKKQHYFFRMISNVGETQDGEFLISVPEDGIQSHSD